MIETMYLSIAYGEGNNTLIGWFKGIWKIGYDEIKLIVYKLKNENEKQVLCEFKLNIYNKIILAADFPIISF
jgi:hypothetical protein